MANPFDTEDPSNPFAEGAAMGSGNSGYNPYESPAYETPAYAEPDNQPTPAPATAQAPKASKPRDIGDVFGKPGDYKDPVSGMVLTQKQLEDRERALDKREAELAEIERQVADGTYVREESDKNFPPFLKWWSWHPDRDLPEDIRGRLKKLMWLFILCTFVYFVNCFACFFCFIRSAEGEVDLGSVATKVVLSIVFFAAFCPLAYEFVFFQLYKALKNGKAGKYICGMIMYAIWWIFLVFNLIGLRDCGSVGFILMLDAWDTHIIAGVTGLIFVILGALDAVLLAWLYIGFWQYYKNNDIKQKAMQEAAGMAVDYAREHPDQVKEIAGAAMDSGAVSNPFA